MPKDFSFSTFDFYNETKWIVVDYIVALESYFKEYTINVTF